MTATPAPEPRSQGGGPPVVLCQGLGMAASSWDPVVADLAPDHQVVTFDRPGLGESEHHRVASWPTLALWTEQLEHALRAATDRPAVLVGHSMAGFVVEALARRRPHLVRGLVLVDGSVERHPAPSSERRLAVWGMAEMALEAVPLVPRRWATAVVEDAVYPDMAADLAELRAREPLPDLPIRVLVAARRTWSPLAARWERKQRELATTLASDGDRPGSRQVEVEVVRPSGHLVMRDRPEAIGRAVRAVEAAAR